MNSIILTFDLEYWFESNSIKKYLRGDETDSLSEFINQLLKLLKAKGASATFFISGKVLSQEPQMIKKIHSFGQEIAVHSLDHQPLWLKQPDGFEQDLKTVIDQIEKIIGEKPIGHRAANFSLDQNTKWLLPILSNNNIKYDSSIFPFKFPRFLAKIYKKSLYGLKSEIFNHYKINFNDPIAKDDQSPLIELPISIFHHNNFSLPLTGGIYIRLIPWFIFKNLLKIKLNQEPACIHFHPFDFQKPKTIKMPWLEKIIKYHNTGNTWKKLEYLLDNFECIAAENYLKL